MPVRYIQELELGELLGSLLRSIVAAQEQAARASIEFVSAVGLVTQQEGGDDVTAMRTVKLRYRKRDENGVTADFEVDVPLLTLVNPPSIAVSEATLNFSYEVLATESAVPTPATVKPKPNASSAPILGQDRPVRLKGVVRSTPTSSQTESRASFAVDVKVTVKQDAMPIGVERLFNLAELGIREAQVTPASPEGRS